MNRREILQSLMALPAVKSIEVASVAPSDVIVIESDDHLNQDAVAMISARAKEVWPAQKIVVLGRGMRLRIARNAVAT